MVFKKRGLGLEKVVVHWCLLVLWCDT